MYLFQWQQSRWDTLKANKMHVKSVFSAYKVLRLWVHGMCCGGVWHIGTNIVVEPGISIFRLRRKELSYPEEGGSRFLQIVWVYQTSWSHIPWLYSQQTKVPITYHMPRFNIHEHQGQWTAQWIPQRYAVSFCPHKTHVDVPPLNLSSTENL